MNAIRVPEGLDAEFLSMLVCPDNREPLHLAPTELVQRANALIAERKLSNAGGTVLDELLEHALVRRDNARLYPVHDGIVTLLVDEAIPLTGELEALARGGA